MIKQVRGDPSLVDQKEEHNIDFRVPGLSHSVAKEAEHIRVQELVQRIENHPHRASSSRLAAIHSAKIRKRYCQKVDSQGEHFTGIHDRFLRDPGYRESQLAIGWSEQKCKEWDELANEDHTSKLTLEETRRYKGQNVSYLEHRRQK